MATDYGTCISVTTDLPLRWKMVTGARVVAEAVFRRWSTDRGSLPYDLDYGTHAVGMIGATMTQGEIASWESRLVSEALKDERVQDCVAIVVYDQPNASAEITAKITPSDGAPFEMVMSINSVTAEIIRVSA